MPSECISKCATAISGHGDGLRGINEDVFQYDGGVAEAQDTGVKEREGGGDI